jgi:hypothetical protein
MVSLPNTSFQRTLTRGGLLTACGRRVPTTISERPMGRPPPALPFQPSAASRCRWRVRAAELGPLGKLIRCRRIE